MAKVTRIPSRTEARILARPRFTAEQLRTRTGHDPRFLGVDLPQLPMQRARNGETWLNYTHFSILMDRKRRLPRVTIVDIVGAKWVQIYRAQEDVWSIDPRIGVGEQPDKTFYTVPDPRFNPAHNDFAFGHMVRRQDPNWDDGDGVTAALAEIDTFHLTNTAPQAESLNSGIWSDLEDVILTDIKSTFRVRVVVLTGPVFRADDPKLHDGIPVPRDFWKIAAWRDGNRLAAAGWTQAQPASVLPLESEPFNPRRSNVWLKPIATIAKQTGLDLAVYVAADTYAERIAMRTANESSRARSRPLRSASDLLMRNPASPSFERLGLSPEQALEIQAARVMAWGDAPRVTAMTEAAAAATPSDAVLVHRVSQKAVDLIVEFETGGRSYYEIYYKRRPVWPKASSGITIGFGYDLGYVTLDGFRHDWAALPAEGRGLLEKVIGRHSGTDGVSDAEMSALLAAVGNVTIEWDLAEAVFRAVTLPKFAAATHRVLPNCDRLPRDCFGALVSLTMNRGGSYSEGMIAGDSLDRYREMRGIRQAMISGQYGGIPGLIRGMTRIWVGTAAENGLRRRRVAEAKLFEEGLATLPQEGAAAAGNSESVATRRTGGPQTATSTTESRSDLDFWTDLSDDDIAAQAARASEAAPARVVWSPDAIQPDYSHLGPGLVSGVAFTLAGGDLLLLAELNAFPIDPATPGPILFGLRGAGMVTDHSHSAGVVLVDQRPDHESTRCVLGVWTPSTGAVHVFPGSTVPNSDAVRSWKRNRRAGNLLSTGIYGYLVGPHTTRRADGSLNSRPGCFLLRTSLDTHRPVVVRRSSNDLSYGLDDLFDRCTPGDNIHPTFTRTGTTFSSLGCQTVAGTTDATGNHQGPWKSFRAAAGLTTPSGVPGTPFQYMLLTGAEARLASEARRDGLTNDTATRRRLRRLRFGSTGTPVRRMQEALGLANPDGNFGPHTAEALHKFQSALPPAGNSDGIFSPALDEALGWRVFAT